MAAPSSSSSSSSSSSAAASPLAFSSATAPSLPAAQTEAIRRTLELFARSAPEAIPFAAAAAAAPGTGTPLPTGAVPLPPCVANQDKDTRERAKRLLAQQVIENLKPALAKLFPTAEQQTQLLREIVQTKRSEIALAPSHVLKPWESYLRARGQGTVGDQEETIQGETVQCEQDILAARQKLWGLALAVDPELHIDDVELPWGIGPFGRAVGAKLDEWYGEHQEIMADALPLATRLPLVTSAAAASSSSSSAAAPLWGPAAAAGRSPVEEAQIEASLEPLKKKIAQLPPEQREAIGKRFLANRQPPLEDADFNTATDLFQEFLVARGMIPLWEHCLATNAGVMQFQEDATRELRKPCGKIYAKYVAPGNIPIAPLLRQRLDQCKTLNERVLSLPFTKQQEMVRLTDVFLELF